MPKSDTRVDAYIAKQAPFAQEILRHIRQQVHAAIPKIEETLKWGMPFFTLGESALVCHMAGFKQHCALGFWRGDLVFGGQTQRNAENQKGEDAMGSFGKIRSLADLPKDKILAGYLKKAAKFALDAETPPRQPKVQSRPKALILPKALKEALARNAAAAQRFSRFAPSQQREYADWISEAKTDATREKRLLTALEWIEEGKTRNWKYMRK